MFIPHRVRSSAHSTDYEADYIWRTTLLPTGFIVTGPNIASQELLFGQLSGRLRLEINGPTVLIRSGDASNLKAALKQIIRDGTNQKNITDDDEGDHVEQFVSVSWPGLAAIADRKGP